MARSSGESRRPRVRKSAPTVRERVEAAREQNEIKSPSKVRRVLNKPAAPVMKLNLSQKSPVKAAAKPFKLLGKGLSWLVPKYFVNSFKELRLVHWPNRRETWRLTLAVFIFSIIFGAMVAGVDKGLDELFKKLVLK